MANKPGPMDLDTLAKTLCDIAWSNGYVLTYKLEKFIEKPEHCCGAADFIYVDGAVCPACQEGNRKRAKARGHCATHAGWKSDCDECYYARFE